MSKKMKLCSPPCFGLIFKFKPEAPPSYEAHVRDQILSPWPIKSAMMQLSSKLCVATPSTHDGRNTASAEECLYVLAQPLQLSVT